MYILLSDNYSLVKQAGRRGITGHLWYECSAIYPCRALKML